MISHESAIIFLHQHVLKQHIMECELIGIPIQEFAELSLVAMQGISDELGL